MQNVDENNDLTHSQRSRVALRGGLFVPHHTLHLVDTQAVASGVECEAKAILCICIAFLNRLAVPAAAAGRLDVAHPLDGFTIVSWGIKSIVSVLKPRPCRERLSKIILFLVG
jgi:hypothetical protein